jgi:hypothetical protein
MLLKVPKEGLIMKSILFAAAAAVTLTSSAAQAEIICTERSGCWETGKKIRLPSSPYRGVDTTVTSRENSNVRQDATKYKYLNDTPQGRR